MAMRNLKVWLAAAVSVSAVAAGPASAATASYTLGSPSDISTACQTQNAEVEQATDPKLGYVYEDWMGCNGIALARSTDGGRTFSAPITLPGSPASERNAWDPAITVGPDGTVYASFMIARSGEWYPVVDASRDHGLTFPQTTSLVPPDAKNW